MRGNVLDMAIGIVIGAAFGKIIDSLVDDIVMPPIGLALGNVDFANLFINLSGKEYPSVATAKAAGAATINYGIFFNTILNFLIIAFLIFLLIRQVNAMQKPKEAPASRRKSALSASLLPHQGHALRALHRGVKIDESILAQNLQYDFAKLLGLFKMALSCRRVFKRKDAVYDRFDFFDCHEAQKLTKFFPAAQSRAVNF
jgi:large conductance mechanosensitive channel